jgi:hypothetical protein
MEFRLCTRAGKTDDDKALDAQSGPVGFVKVDPDAMYRICVFYLAGSIALRLDSCGENAHTTMVRGDGMAGLVIRRHLSLR